MMCRGGVHEGLGCMQRWSATKVKCKGGVHARLGSGAVPNANTPRAPSGPVRIFGHAGGRGLAEFRRYLADLLLIYRAMHPSGVRRMEN